MVNIPANVRDFICQKFSVSILQLLKNLGEIEVNRDVKSIEYGVEILQVQTY